MNGNKTKGPNFEDEPEGAEIGVSIQDLRKVYKVFLTIYSQPVQLINIYLVMSSYVQLKIRKFLIASPYKKLYFKRDT